MSDKPKNALVELAIDMQVIRDGTVNPAYRESADKAMRIIAEIAKVEFLTCDGAIIGTVLTQADRAIIKSREIAEEGTTK